MGAGAIPVPLQMKFFQVFSYKETQKIANFKGKKGLVYRSQLYTLLAV